MKTVLLAFAPLATAVGPVQKVLTLLEDLKAKVNADGEVEADQYQKYSKWCEDESSETGYAIETGTNKKGDLEAQLEQLNADISKSESDIGSLAQAISANEADFASAKKIRASEAADFKKAEEELSSAIDELVRAASVLRKAGLGGSAGTAAQLKAALSQIAGGLSTVMNAAFIDVEDKRKLSALMQAPEDDDFTPPSGAPEAAAYESHSTGIMDTLAELKVKAEGERAELRKDEMNKKHSYEMLAQSLTDQISTQTRDLNSAKATKAKKSEARGVAEGDLASTSKNLKADKAYLADLTQTCEAKANAWADRQKNRAEELEALEKGIEILSGDKFQAAAAARLPKQFVQLSTRSDVRTRVSELLQEAANRLHSVGLAQLAVRTRAGDDPFGKVKSLISDMITRLMTQAAQEADHKQYCDEEKAKSLSKREKFNNRVEDQTSRIDVAEAGVAKLKEEIADLSAEVSSMDKSMAEATVLRQKESTEYAAAMADYKEGQDALTAAISVLQEYYSKNESALQQAKFDGPIFSGPYEKRVDGATGIIGILEVAASDFARMEAEAQASEMASRKAFTKMKNESEVNRAMKTTAIKSKEGEATRVSNLVADLKSDRTGSQKELDAVIEYLAKLKSRCEHTPMTFAERAARRKQEIESLQDALRILEAEAPTSLLQRVRKH